MRKPTLPPYSKPPNDNRKGQTATPIDAVRRSMTNREVQDLETITSSHEQAPDALAEAQSTLLPLRMVDRLLWLTLDLANGPDDTGWQLRRWADAVAELALLMQLRRDGETSDRRSETPPPHADVSCTLLDAECNVVAVGLPAEDVRPREANLFDRVALGESWVNRIADVVNVRRHRPVVISLDNLTCLDADDATWLAAVRHHDGFWLLTLVDLGPPAKEPLRKTQASGATLLLRSNLRLMHARSAGLISTQTTDADVLLSPRLALTLDHLLTGKTEAEIADAVHRSPHTVHANVKELYRLYGVSSRPALMAKFIHRGSHRTHHPQ